MTDLADEFQEIAHCGGQFTVRVSTDSAGRRSAQFGVRHSRPTAAAWFAIYALPPGIPVGMIELRGIGQPWNPAPVPECVPVFIASDSQGMFGHRCPRCRGYWRSKGAPSRWEMTCPYCGYKDATHGFLTQGQQTYVEEFCRLVSDALDAVDGEHVMDMDEVADAAGQDLPKPRFYYAEESQQNKFHCVACGAFNDILGRYGYCSHCGTHNGLDELGKDVAMIHNRIASATEYEACARDAVAAFDSFARQLAEQLAHRVPMTRRRRKEWKRRLFHQLAESTQALREAFDIDPVKGIAPKDVAFATLMFHRRHVYEHNGGEVDEKYIRDSGDTSVRPKQLIHESRESATRIADLVLKLGSNIADGFHDIFPPERDPIRLHNERG